MSQVRQKPRFSRNAIRSPKRGLPPHCSRYLPADPLPKLSAVTLLDCRPSPCSCLSTEHGSGGPCRREIPWECDQRKAVLAGADATVGQVLAGVSALIVPRECRRRKCDRHRVVGMIGVPRPADDVLAADSVQRAAIERPALLGLRASCDGRLLRTLAASGKRQRQLPRQNHKSNGAGRAKTTAH